MTQALSLPRDRIKVLLLEGIHQSAVDAFTAAGYTRIERYDKALPPAELAHKIADAHLVGIRSRSQLDEAALAAAQKLIAVGCFCIGTNQVDLAAAKRRGVPVFNAPFSNTRSVAELVIAETILLMRNIPAKNALLHRGGWDKSAADSFEVRGKTLGIVGYGNIGTQVGVLAEALGMQVLFCDIENKLPLGNARQVTFAELCARADAITLHVPQTAQTQGMIGAGELATMKDGVRLINASRGNVIDIGALAVALERGKLSGAAVDVFPHEPEHNAEPFVSALTAFDNVILTPHIGGSTQEAQANIGHEVAAKLVRYSDNGSTLSAVNFPEVSLPAHAGKCRLLHIHRNRPGVLAHVNEALAKAGANIAAQYLQTDADIGYVVVETDNAASQDALAALARVEDTLRCRVLY